MRNKEELSQLNINETSDIGGLKSMIDRFWIQPASISPFCHDALRRLAEARARSAGDSGMTGKAMTREETG